MRIPIRLKLAGALAVPLAALVGFAGYEAVQADRVASEAAAETALATAAVGPGSLISQLQFERNLAGVDQLGLSDAQDQPVRSNSEARASTDRAVEEFRDFVARSGADVEAAFEDGLARLSDLETLRSDIDESTLAKGPSNTPFANHVFHRYTLMIRELLDDTAGVALQVDDAELRTGVELVDLTTRAYEIRADIVRSMILPTLTGDTSAGVRAYVAGLVATSETIDAALLARSVGPYEGLPEAAFRDVRVVRQDRLFATYLADGTADLATLATQISSPRESGHLGLRSDVASALQAEADAVLGEARDQRFLIVGGAIAFFLLALLVTILASRSITRPLRSLTQQAQAMAAERLPAAVQRVLDTPLGDDVVVPDIEPVVVNTRDEVSDVAAALNTVQSSALDLALEQAVLRRNIADSFVNLGRRNQNLLGRQLDFISDLERQETDSERLEGLFRLDHLATRMRRNAESLLRLAGGAPGGGGGGWSGPVPVVDVVRGALGEVEDYQRVDVRSLEPATVNGSAGADLAHALAELVENALAYSPPHERVEVRGRRTESGYVLAVVDQGIGMSAEQLEVANRRLASQESFTVAPSRYLGHYVAGHLATTHGIHIELQGTPAGGITARLDVPETLLERGAEPAPTAEPAPLRAPVTWPEPVIEPPAADTEPEPALVGAAPTDSTRDDALAPPAAPEPANPVPSWDGFGGLARVEPPVTNGDVAAAENGNGHGAGDDGLTTPSGLARRVRGAQAPTTAVFTSPAAALGWGADAEPVVPAATPPSAEDFSSFLSAFSGGVERGLTEAHAEDDPRGTES